MDCLKKAITDVFMPWCVHVPFKRSLSLHELLPKRCMYIFDKRKHCVYIIIA